MVGSMARLQLLGLGARSGDPHPQVLVDEADGVEQDPQALALLVAPDEQDRLAVVDRAVGAGRIDPRLGRRELVDLDSVEQDRPRLGDRDTGQGLRVLGDGDLGVDPRPEPAGEARHRLVHRLLAGSVERPDDRGRTEHECRHGRAGHERLVQMEDVELLVPQRPHGAQLRLGVGRDRGDGTVGGVHHRRPDDRDTALGGRGVRRRQDLDVVPTLAQRPGQTQHLALHTTGHGEAVGTDHPDVHDADPAQPRRGGGVMPSAS